MDKKQGNIRVFCRFRPFNAKEESANPTKIHRIVKKKQLIIKDLKSEDMSFMYDKIFEMDSTQQQIFEQMGTPVLDNVLEGYHGTIMAYGQTSSGKTHTMQGYDMNDKEAKGIMPRMIDKLFQAIEKSPESIQYKLKISIFQLYMEKIRDLLDITKKDLRVRQNKQGVYVEDLTEAYVGDKYELLKIINYGQKNRVTCSTNMNDNSSRSHLIFQLSVNQFNNTESSSKTSKLFLVDLAGSEKISKTGALGKVLEEAKKINLSLTNLGKVIKSLSQRINHIPYRDSKLTRILKDSLGGNSKTTLIVTCSPHEMHLPQSLSTLRFGQNAQKVKNKPKINRQMTVEQLQKIIDKMENETALKDLKIKSLQFYITGTLKAELPKEIKLIVPEIQEETEELLLDSKQMQLASKEAQERMIELQKQLECSQAKIKYEGEKYYQLKKQYNQLHSNLTEILKQNIQLQQKKNELILDPQKLAEDNSQLIKLIVGEIMSHLDQEQQKQIVSQIKQSFWFQKSMVEGKSLTDYWHQEKIKLNQELQGAFQQSKLMENQIDQTRLRNQNRVNKDNQKIMQLEYKIDMILKQYNEMMNLQTTWKAQCQLYERKIKKKEQKIGQLERMLQDIHQQMEDIDDGQFNDNLSVKSNRIIKPLKGGFIFH